MWGIFDDDSDYVLKNWPKPPACTNGICNEESPMDTKDTEENVNLCLNMLLFTSTERTF